MMALPCFEQRVDLILRAHVDAAGRLVEDQDVGVAFQPLGHDDLLLVAAGEAADLDVDAGGTRAQLLHVILSNRTQLLGSNDRRMAAMPVLKDRSLSRSRPYCLRSSDR